jgi:hypothetical protein
LRAQSADPQAAQKELSSRFPLSATRSRGTGVPATKASASAGTCMAVMKALLLSLWQARQWQV